MKKIIRPIAIRIRHLKGRFSDRPRSDLFYKQQRLLEIGSRYRCSALVETGTYLGDTVKVASRYFDRVLSVELSTDLYGQNLERFRKYRNVILWQGSSGERMPEMLSLILSEKALFWLDAHYSGAGTAGGESNCPILSELEAIAAHPRRDHCILIDDARCFGQAGYPSIERVKEKLLTINPSFHVQIDSDCIIALPPL
jgi:hypothetical protein